MIKVNMTTIFINQPITTRCLTVKQLGVSIYFLQY